MATKTKTKVEEPTKDEENIKDIPVDNPAQDNDDIPEDPKDDSNDKTDKPEKETETFGTKMKKLGGKIKSGAKKALPYVGAFAAGAGAAVGALIVMTKPDGTELELLPQNDDLVPADQFIEGEATVVEESDGETE